MGYLGDVRLGLNFGRIGRFDSKYFGRWEIDLVREQQNGRNGKIHGSTYLGAGRLAVIKVGDWEIDTPPSGASVRCCLDELLDLSMKGLFETWLWLTGGCG